MTPPALAAHPSSTGPAATRLDRGDLIIERVETLALRVPLPRRFVGSAYSMTNRTTIITRLATSDGVVSATSPAR